MLVIDASAVVELLLGASEARGSFPGSSRNPLLPRIWQLRQNLTAYAAAYVALAEALGCPLLTFDAGLSRVPGVDVRIVPEDA